MGRIYPMSTERIRKNDIVIVTSGANVGKTGKVLEILSSKGRAIVEGLNLRKKCMRKTKDNPNGGIIEKEASITLSNLMPHCPQCKKGVRIRREQEAGKTVRKCKFCGHTFEV
jgi:large subunit ribosomal protein L24